MKSIAFKCVLIIAVNAFLFSCSKKDSNTPDPAQKQANDDYKLYTQVFQDFNIAANQASNSYKDTSGANNRISSSCFQFSWITNTSTGNAMPGFGINYSKISLVFSGSACDDGIIRSGKIDLYFSGWFDTWKDSLVFDNYVQNGVKITGYRTSKFNSSLKQSNEWPYNVRIDGDIVSPGKYNLHYSTNEIHRVKDLFTSNAAFELTGNGSLKDNATGYTIYGNVTSPIVTKGSCSPAFYYPVQGIIQFTNNIYPNSKTSVNYGSGSCDRNAVYTDVEGKPYSFTF